MEQVQITEEQIVFLEQWNTPKAFVETMFPNFDNPGIFNKERFGELRLYQKPFISDLSLIDFSATAKYHNLDKKQEFKLKETVGTIYLFGARRFGKTICAEKLDLLIDMSHSDATTAIFASASLIHLNEVLDSIKAAFTSHSILKLWYKSIKGAPNYKFQLKNNYILQSVNFNLGSKASGTQFFGKHVFIIYIEEASLETDEVYKKRLDAISELGVIIRSSGMTNFTPYSPAGLAYYAPENRKHVINLPQFVNPYWDETEKKNRLIQFGGEDAINYRVFVKGEIVEDSITAIDMSRVRAMCYQEKKQIKRFEITKDRYPFFRNTIVVERPNNAERIFLSSDIGKKVTEIVVHSEIDGKYYYLYNIVLYNLTTPEKQEILDFLIIKLQANVIGFDCGDGEGRAIYSYFEQKYSQDNLVYYAGTKKIEVDWEYDENKNIKIEKGEPVYRRELMSEFSVQRLKDLLYAGKIKIPEDYKFDSQFSVVVSMTTGTRTTYKCVSESGDHLFDAYRVFAIAEFLKSDSNLTKPVEPDWGSGVMST